MTIGKILAIGAEKFKDLRSLLGFPTNVVGNDYLSVITISQGTQSARNCPTKFEFIYPGKPDFFLKYLKIGKKIKEFIQTTFFLKKSDFSENLNKLNCYKKIHVQY